MTENNSVENFFDNYGHEDEIQPAEFTEIPTPQEPKKPGKSGGSAAPVVISGVVGGIIGAVLVGGALTFFNPSSSAPVANNSSTTKTVKSTVNSKDEQTVIAVDGVKKSVVTVFNLQTVKESAASDFYKKYFGGGSTTDSSDSANEPQLASEGSGAIYKKDGKTAYIVTNNHVVDGAEKLQVQLYDGTKVDAELVGKDATTDLAVLKISSDKVEQVAEFANSEDVKVGETAIALGSPLGSENANSVTKGIVSATNREVTEPNGSTFEAIQTDASINPGNSGGPLVNISGQIIGINVMKISSSGEGVSAEGLGYAIPSNSVVSIVNQIEKDGKVIRPAIGISMRDLSTVSAESRKNILKLPDDVTDGVVLVGIQAVSPAQKAGLKKYDVITEFDGKKITSGTELRAILFTKKMDSKVEVTYYRNGEKKTATLTLSITQDALTQDSEPEDLDN
ncbi:MAG: trypsin-like peptidase domain-containing protein [Lactobacillales bacterium]|jgi:serine protease Do|nr:trypsin-like peptidase domain-containing protein [Lactobacillales bacterium]